MGVELEFYTLLSIRQLNDILIANGINCIIGDYRTCAPTCYTVVLKTDASIRPDRSLYSYNGIEATFMTKLDSEGHSWTKKVCNLLVTIGAKVNTSCGCHVHVDAHDCTLEIMQSLYNLCFKYEEVIGGFIPKGSRGRDYAKLRRTDEKSLLERAENLWEVQNIIDCRKYGLNLLSYWKDNRKTIEFRYHSPTVDFEKVWYWAMLCQRLYEHAKARDCNSKDKLANTNDNLRNFLCAVGLKPNNRIYDVIDNRLNDCRDYLVQRWLKFKRQDESGQTTTQVEV
jgi:hypothetical protein